MDKVPEPKNKDMMKDIEFMRNISFEEEIYKYSVEEYNNLLDAKPWKKELFF